MRKLHSEIRTSPFGIEINKDYEKKGKRTVELNYNSNYETTINHYDENPNAGLFYLEVSEKSAEEGSEKVTCSMLLNMEELTALYKQAKKLIKQVKKPSDDFEHGTDFL
jgi:hypothetical protein